MAKPSIAVPRTRVLLAEDDRTLRGMLAEALRHDGHDVVEASDGFELAAQIQRAWISPLPALRPDVIVSDIEMPGPDGPSVLARLRRVDRVTPIILMSGRIDRAVKVLAARLAIHVMLHKPFAPRALCESVRAIVGGHAH